jgi:hypothetical protein
VEYVPFDLFRPLVWGDAGYSGSYVRREDHIDLPIETSSAITP